MVYFILISTAFVSGIIQTVTGFGAGIFLMLILPLVYPILTATALNGSITIILNAMLVWHYRKYVNLKQVIFPSIIYFLVSTVVVYYAPDLPKDLITKLLGIVMILLSAYFLFFPNQWKLKASTLTASLCAALAGTTGGLFGIGGPPMVVYFLSALESKEEYLGTIQFFFMITGIENFIVRAIRGIYTVDLIPLTLLGIVGIVFGKLVGQKIVDRINGELMKKIVYIFLGISGILNLF